MKHKAYNEAVEKYRTQYLAGEITQVQIQQLEHISFATVNKHIKSNEWDIALAFHNRKQIILMQHYSKIEKYKNDYENAATTVKNIATEVGVHSNVVTSYIKDNNWNRKANRDKAIKIATSNLKPLTAEAREMGRTAMKDRWNRLHKFAENKQKNDIVYISGIPFVWCGFKNNKAILQRTPLIYSCHTYSDVQISKLAKNQK